LPAGAAPASPVAAPVCFFAMTFRLLALRFHVLPMRTRFPFRYGIASMTAVPHLFVSARIWTDGREVDGVASEGLPPKWFTKTPDTPFEADLAEMLAAIQNAARIGSNAAARPTTFFPWWRDLHDEQKHWASLRRQPPLLVNLGVSLMERAVLDALCRTQAQPLHALLANNAFGLRLEELRPEVAGLSLQQLLPAAPLTRVAARHTVGLSDPLRAGDIPAAERLDDGLPQSLEDCIKTYQLTHFKIKVCGQPEHDLPRLRELTRVLETHCTAGFQTTLDGNEQFADFASFRDFYDRLAADRSLQPLFRSLLFIEQPLHRDHALGDAAAAGLREWHDAPPLIIDESDGSLDDLPRALDLGYHGTSHKNCKGVIKSLANAALLRVRAPQMSRAPIQSAEDLVNVGPVALLQDLAVVAALGIPHVERNGHHYFRGLSMHTPELQDRLLDRHHGLYERHHQGFATLAIHQGHLDLQSVNSAPFGCGLDLDPTAFLPLHEWVKAGGLAELG
jgi:hypothetical protein